MYILLFIGSFIFNEFLVINICSLANGTKLFLDYKEQNDLSLISEISKDNYPLEYLSESNKEEKDSIKSMELNEY